MSRPVVSAALVRWLDSASFEEDFEEDAIPEAIEVVSVGHLVYRGPDRIVLALNRSFADDSDPYGMAIAIPTVAVVEVQEIELEDNR